MVASLLGKISRATEPVGRAIMNGASALGKGMYKLFQKSAYKSLDLIGKGIRAGGRGMYRLFRDGESNSLNLAKKIEFNRENYFPKFKKILNGEDYHDFELSPHLSSEYLPKFGQDKSEKYSVDDLLKIYDLADKMYKKGEIRKRKYGKLNKKLFKILKKKVKKF